MELDSVLEEIVGRGLINDEQPSLVCLHCLICHDLSSLVLSVLNLCHHCFEECPCLSSSTWKVCSYVIRRFDHQKTIPTEDDTSFSNYKDDNYIHHDQDLINVDYLKTRMSSLLEAFPEPFFNHAMAVKVKSLLYATTLESDFKTFLFYICNLRSIFSFMILMVLHFHKRFWKGKLNSRRDDCGQRSGSWSWVCQSSGFIDHHLWLKSSLSSPSMSPPSPGGKTCA